LIDPVYQPEKLSEGNSYCEANNHIHSTHNTALLLPHGFGLFAKTLLRVVVDSFSVLGGKRIAWYQVFNYKILITKINNLRPDSCLMNKLDRPYFLLREEHKDGMITGDQQILSFRRMPWLSIYIFSKHISKLTSFGILPRSFSAD
jgi:hypothetical protein